MGIITELIIPFLFVCGYHKLNPLYNRESVLSTRDEKLPIYYGLRF
jgi:hypothetical protein